MELEKEIYHFASHYIENYISYISLSDRLLQTNDYEEWLVALKDRSITTRRIFDENEASLAWLNEILDQLNEEKAEVIYHALIDVFFDKFRQIDFPILIQIAEKILPLFEAQQNYDRMVRLYSALMYWNMEYFGRKNGQISRKDTLYYATKALECRQYYHLMQEKESRIRLIRTYSNLVGAVVDIYHLSFQEVKQWYQDAVAFWNSSIVQEMDGEDEDFCAEMEWLQDSFIEYCYEKVMEDFSETKDSEKIQFCLNYLHDSIYGQERADEEKNGIYLRASYLLAVIEQKKTPEQILDELFRFIKKIPYLDFEKYSDDENLEYLDEFFMTTCSYFHFLKLSKLSRETKRQMAQKVMGIIDSQVQYIPGNVYTDFVNDILADYFLLEMPYLSSLQEKISELQKLIICRQPMTFVHCYMVELLAIEIAKELIKITPEYFVGLPGFENVEIVRADEQALLEYIRCCGVLHDVGKCKIAGVINMQIRKITDEEFQCIRLHPQYGYDLLCDDADFDSFLPIILGHHKFYDGKQGYPSTFQNCESPYRGIIDLITICDCLDSATDIIGRNYARGKTFEQVLEELREGAGTRYNPQIVHLISDQADLRSKLSYLTREGRSQAYFAAFSECRKFIRIYSENREES